MREIYEPTLVLSGGTEVAARVPCPAAGTRRQEALDSPLVLGENEGKQPDIR